MRALPSEPTQHVGLAAQIRRPEPALGALRRHVEQDGVRLPKHEFAILEGRHLPVRIESEILRSELVATTEIDRIELAIESKMVLECDDDERARRGWEEVESHHKSSPPNGTRCGFDRGSSGVEQAV